MDETILDYRYTLDVIRALPGTDSIGENPRRGQESTAKTLNDVRVRCRLPGGKAAPHDPDAKKEYITVHCSPAVKTKLDAALELKRQLGEILGPEALTAAEAAVQKRLALPVGGASSFFKRSQAAQQRAVLIARLKKELNAAWHITVYQTTVYNACSTVRTEPT
jgi:hypothetical protein